MCIIPDLKPVVYPSYLHRILYAGNDLMLLRFLQYELKDCQIIRCPNGAQARLFIEKIKYSLLLFDEELPDTTGRELTEFARELPYRRRTPVIICKPFGSYDVIVRAITRALAV